MVYSFPEEETLVKYLSMLRQVLLEARFLAYSSDPRIAKLLDAVENVPDLLCRWSDMEEKIVIGELRAYEEKYLNGGEKFTRILREGPREGWQEKWTNANQE